MLDYRLTGDLAVITLCSPPVNALTFALLDELRAAVRRAGEDARVRALVVSGGTEHFSAGADLSIFEQIRCDNDALHASRFFQEVYQQIEDSAKPVVAAVAGHVLGGALELALACHLRVAAEGSRFSMPEVRLAISPGAGGTQRLPRLIGVEAALEMLLTGRVLDAPQALSAGLIDAVCPADRCVARAEALLRPTPAIRRTGQRTERIGDAAANREALAKARQQAATGRPEIVACQKIVEAVAAGLENPLPVALRREGECFRDCMASPAAQNKIYIFRAGRQAGKIAVQTPAAGDAGAEARACAKVGVLGMGTMGTGIVSALLAADIAVAACDADPAALEQAMRRIQASFEHRVGKGRLAADQAERALARLSTGNDCRILADADVVIEAVFEDIEVKRAALRRVEEVCPPTTLIASNTSTINLDLLAEGMRQPARLLGMHFFHPAQHMPLVEIVRRHATPDQAVLRALQLAKRIGKTPVVVRNREGFIVTRLFVPYLKEAFWLLEEGAEPAQLDRAMVDFGCAMGPLQSIDMSGLDILDRADAVLRAALPRHGPLPEIARELVRAGQLGQKTGAGVYRYLEGDRTPLASPTAAGIIAAARARRAPPASAPTAKQIVRRLMLRMVNEAFYLLEEGTAAQAADIDVAMVLGTGLPDFRGGVVRFAEELGFTQVLAWLDEFATQCGPRFEPCALFRDKTNNSVKG